jgi:hypothetical protein
LSHLHLIGFKDNGAETAAHVAARVHGDPVSVPLNSRHRGMPMDNHHAMLSLMLKET